MLLRVNNLKTHFRVGLDKIAKAVDGVSFELEQGKTLALVGESGCGKTQTAFSLMRLVADNGYHPSGEILFNGADLSKYGEDEMRSIRGNEIAMIFQEPMTSLNPLYRIGNQLEEPLRLHRKMQKADTRKRAIDLLDRVGIPDPDKRIDDFPHQLSGGMKQRVMIAMALACEPKLLIADEPTTALDVTIQAQVLRLMSDLQQQTGMSILLITHDLGIVNQMADHLSIMYAGRIVEQGTRGHIFSNLSHPYTRRLFESIPKAGDAKYFLNTIPGMVPPATEYGAGCLFADRCHLVMDKCKTVDSPAYKINAGHTVNCHLFESPAEAGLNQDRIGVLAPPRNLQEVILSVRSLKTWFPVHKGILNRVADHIRAVDGVSIDIQRGGTLALVGESGCGKTTLGESVLKLVRNTGGEVLFQGRNIFELDSENLKQIRKHMQIIFQDPFGSLSPRMTVEDIIVEGLRVHYPNLTPQEKRNKIDKVLREVGLDSSLVDRYPHEFSGGQRQRISIARALILEPEFLILDEPTSALDVSVQAQVLNLLRELQAARNLTYLFITHNLNVVQYMADHVAIMYLGRIVEYSPVKELFENPIHPYTKSLLGAVPSLGERKKFDALLGDVPSPLSPPRGCYFHPRCPVLLSAPKTSSLQNNCRESYPATIATGNACVACHAADPNKQ